MNPCVAVCGRGGTTAVAALARVFGSEESAISAADGDDFSVSLNEGPLQADCQPGEDIAGPRGEIPRRVGNFLTQGFAAEEETLDDFAVVGGLREP